MRSFDENDDSDKEEAKRLGAKPWMLDMLKVNPGYVFWGPHEDYMWTRGDGWNSEVIVPTWPEFKFSLDELNECVNFYFHVGRASEECKTCGGNGYHPDAQWVTESFYSHCSPFTRPMPRMAAIIEGMNRAFGSGMKPSIHGNDAFPSEATLSKYNPEFRAFCESMRIHGSWSERLTPQDLDALRKEGRHIDGMHDAINRGIMSSAKLERYGIPETCEACEGHGHVFTAPEAHLSLTLWWLHPRKGCSRGIEITRIEESEILAACTFLREAAKRNAKRFSKLPK